MSKRLYALGFVALIMAFPVRLPAVVVAEQTAQQKANEHRAKILASEGDTLKKAKKWVEAREKYVEALRLGENLKYDRRVLEVDAEIDKLIRKELEAAESLYAASKYDQALARLDATVRLREADAAVLYNRALIAQKQGKTDEAVRHVEAALASVSNEKERMRLMQLKTQWETGEVLQAHSPEREEQVKDLNELLAAGETGAETCAKLRALAGSLSKSPSVVFNLAKCAEDEGKLEEASQLLDQYLVLAPKAMDSESMKTDLEEVRDLERRAGAEILTLYAEADRAARRGRYKRAISALMRAEAASPGLPDTQARLARLHQAAGSLSDARAHYEKFLSLETNESMLLPVRDELAALEKRANEYQALVDPARARLLTWMHTYIVDGRPMGSAAAHAELKAIAEQLQRASVMMPLGTELNRMLGEIYLIDGNYPAARKAFSVVAEAGEPIWFYAIASGLPSWDKNILAKVELHGHNVRVFGVSKIEKKRYVTLTGGTTPSERLGGFVTPAQFPESAGNGPRLEIASLANAETNDDSVKVVWNDGKSGSAAKREAKLSPFRFSNGAPYSGPAARRFANAYTKLFRDFADVPIKLGAERLTGGEKFGMAMELAMAAYAGAGLSMASGLQGTANIIAAAMRSATWASVELQNGLDRQARMFQESQFKIMLVEDPKPMFRKDLFR